MKADKKKVYAFENQRHGLIREPKAWRCRRNCGAWPMLLWLPLMRGVNWRILRRNRAVGMDATNGDGQPYEPKSHQTYHSGNPFLQPALHVADIQVELQQFRSHGVPKQVRKDSPRNAQTSGSKDIS